MTFALAANEALVDDTSTSTLALPAINQAAGQLIIASIAWESTDTTVTVADTAGNTFTPLTKRKHTATDMWVQEFYCLTSAANAANVTTFTWVAAAPYKHGRVATFSLTGTAAFGTEGTRELSAGTANGPIAITPSSTGENLLHTANKIFDGSPNSIWAGAGSGTWVEQGPNFDLIYTQYQPVTGTSAINGGANNSSAANQVLTYSTFYEVVSGPVTTPVEGVFSPLAVPAGWFSRFAQPAGWYSKYFLDTASGGGGGIAVGLATTTETAFALTPRLIATTGVATSTETAISLAARQVGATALAVSTDTAINLAARQIGTTGLATTTETAFALASPAPGISPGIAVETSTAFALAAVLRQSAGVATTTETAIGLVARQLLPTGAAIETSTALAPSARQLQVVGLASTADQAFARTAVLRMLAGIALEANSALALLPNSPGAVGMAIETNTAFALSSVIGGAAGDGGITTRRRRR